MEQIANCEQAALWNGASGLMWVEEQAVLDETYESIAGLLADAAIATGAHTVLDVGCGSGATTVAVARRLGSDGTAVGIDISAPLLELARARAARERVPASFVRADAQTHAFAPGKFDLLISRFGVMFFDDPVAAFTNLRRAATDRAEMRQVVFRSIAENPFMTTAERAAAPLLADVPPRKPGAPGQFAFADRERVRRILEEAGWSGVELAPLDIECAFPSAALARYFTRLGPVGLALRNADKNTRARAIDAIRAAFAPFVDGAKVRFVAACWMISGTAAR